MPSFGPALKGKYMQHTLFYCVEKMTLLLSLSSLIFFSSIEADSSEQSLLGNQGVLGIGKETKEMLLLGPAAGWLGLALMAHSVDILCNPCTNKERHKIRVLRYTPR